jgi:hypothetical protein
MVAAQTISLEARVSRDGCTLAEALHEARSAGLVLQPGGWLFMHDPQELAALCGAPVWVTDYGVRREVLLPNGDRLTLVPADKHA